LKLKNQIKLEIGTDGLEIVSIIVGGGNISSKGFFNYVKLDYHENIIFNMTLSHWLKRDLLIVGPKGCGKSVSCYFH
jgi:hypothetical protein